MDDEKLTAEHGVRLSMLEKITLDHENRIRNAERLIYFGIGGLIVFQSLGVVKQVLYMITGAPK